MISNLPRQYGFGFLNQEMKGPIEPGAADMELDAFRKYFPYHKGFAFEDQMTYVNGSSAMLKCAQEIITKQNLALSASVHNRTLFVKYVPEVAACRRLMIQQPANY